MGILTALVSHSNSTSSIDNGSSIDAVAIETEHIVGYSCGHLSVDAQKSVTTSNWSSVPNNRRVGSEKLWQVLSMIVESLEKLSQEALCVGDCVGYLLLSWAVAGVHVVWNGMR